MWCFSITFSFLRERCRSASASPGENIFRAGGGGGAGVQCFPSVFWYMFVYEMCVCVSVKLVYVCEEKGVCMCVKFVSVSGLCMFVYLRCEVCMSVCVCMYEIFMCMFVICVHADVLPV